jgi:hypothetical protein
LIFFIARYLRCEELCGDSAAGGFSGWRLTGAFAPEYTVCSLRLWVWALAMLARGPHSESSFRTLRPALPSLLRSAYSNDVKIRGLAFRAVLSLADGPVQRIQAVLESGVVHRLTECLESADEDIQTHTSTTMYLIVSRGKDDQVKWVVDAGLIQALPTLLSSQVEIVRARGCAIVRALAERRSTAVNRLIDFVGPKMVEMVLSLRSHLACVPLPNTC